MSAKTLQATSLGKFKRLDNLKLSRGVACFVLVFDAVDSCLVLSGNAAKIAVHVDNCAAYLRQLTCSGAIAQLGERIVRNDEVVGSIPTSSTMFSITCGFPVVQFCPKLVQKFQQTACRSLPQLP